MSSTSQVLTYNGYDMFECVSALQKSIRRGLEEDAVHWGVELYISGFVPYAWKRLRIIAVEDVGIANCYALMIVDHLKSLHDDLVASNDKKKQYRMPFVQAILFLCDCNKSRYVDWCQNYWFDELIMNGGQKEMPSYAVDMHTRKGKIMGKTIEDFFNEGSYIEKNGRKFPYDKEEWYKNECKRRWTSDSWNEACKKAKEKWESMVGEAKPSRKSNSTQLPPNTGFDLFN